MNKSVLKTSVKAPLFKVRRLVLALVFLFAAQGVWGETYIWTGTAGDNKWDTITNWKTVNITEQGTDNAAYTVITDISNPATSAPSTTSDIVYITNTPTIK